MKNKQTFGLNTIIWDALKAHAVRKNVSVKNYVKYSSYRNYIIVNNNWMPVYIEHGTNHYQIVPENPNSDKFHAETELAFLIHHGLDTKKLYKSNY